MADTPVKASDAQSISVPSPPPAPVANNMLNSGPTPVMDSGMTFSEIGNSGLRAFAGYVREEFLPQLQGRQAATVYREMSDNSPIIGGIVYAIHATMRKVEWRTVPADDTPEAQELADFADSLREDMSHTWEDSIAEGLSMIQYGYAPQEIVYKRRLGQEPGMDPRRPGKSLPTSNYDDGRVGWKKLPIRGQDTVIKWFFDDNGGVEGMTQQPWVGSLVDIPMEKLLLFRPSQHKNNPEGRSVLRNAYRSYYMIKRMEEQEAILYERMNGIPVIKIPAEVIAAAAAGDATATATVEAYKRIVVNLRIDEQMGLILPSNAYDDGKGGSSSVMQYSLELVAPGGNGGRSSTQSDPTIVRHQNNMLISVLADFLSLGHGQTGTQALAVSKTGMFFQAIEGYLNSMAGVYNRHALPRVWRLNGLPMDKMPEYQPDLAHDVDLDVLSGFVQKLAASGMAMFPNPVLEQALLDAAGLPDVNDANALEALGGDPTEGDGPVAIAGPMAAKATQELAPPPEPVAGSPADKFAKMIRASMAKRILRKRGGLPLRAV